MAMTGTERWRRWYSKAGNKEKLLAVRKSRCWLTKAEFDEFMADEEKKFRT